MKKTLKLKFKFFSYSKAQGYPSPTITWSREDGYVLPSGQAQTKVDTLVIPNARKEDRGEKITSFNIN